MASKKTKQRIRERMKADQPRWDDVTRRLQEAIERYRLRAERERAGGSE
jgi:hypothetical protein